MKQNMFKTIVLSGVIALSALPATAAEALHVHVPFSFVAGGAKLAAGDYNITQSENGVVTLVGEKTSAMVLTVPAGYTSGAETKLSFSSSNADKVLTSIQVGGFQGREIPLHSAERQNVLASAR